MKYIDEHTPVNTGEDARYDATIIERAAIYSWLTTEHEAGRLSAKQIKGCIGPVTDLSLSFGAVITAIAIARLCGPRLKMKALSDDMIADEAMAVAQSIMLSHTMGEA